MWNRADLKSKAKFSFKRNYWKSVLISLLLAIIVGGGGSGASSFTYGFNDGIKGVDRESVEVEHIDDANDYGDIDDFADGFAEGFKDEMSNPGPMIAALAIVGFTFLIIFLIIMAIVILLDVFIFNPIEVGCKRFYFRNLNEPAQVGNIGYAFDNNYKNITKTMFFRDLYTILWSLLFIIPGIVKSYEYQMIPYLLADNPQMSKEAAFAESKRMMSGQKWKAFVLDLSFIGWWILSALTLGIVGIFYVQPYMDGTHAALYESLRYGTPYGMSDNSIPYTEPDGFTNAASNSIVEENPQQ